MPTLTDYQQFAGTHWETGTVHNYLAYRGARAPHTGAPFSEALLLGVSGGLVVGYFTFRYEGWDPQCNILTRNTFNPFDTMLSRLGVVQHREQTASSQKAADLLAQTLDEGVPAIVWADMWSLPYNGLDASEDMWVMFPILVYGFDPDAGVAHIADRARVPLTASAADLATARGRVKKDKHRLLTLDPPRPEKLAEAVAAGIWDTIRLFTEKPPKGAAHNFGLAALRYWVEMLTLPKKRNSWARLFPPGLPLYAGLTSAYHFAFLFGKGESEDAERGLYADFLEEAAAILDRPALREVAAAFRASAAAWGALAEALLPGTVPPLVEARRLMRERHTLFLARGGDAVAELRALDARLATIREGMLEEFPLDAVGAAALQAGVAERLTRIHDLEAAAVAALRAAMA